MTRNRQALLDAFLNKPIPVIVYRAVVESVQEKKRCTVKLLAYDLIVEDVDLIAEEDASGWFCITPTVGSIVLVGSIDNEVSDLFLLQYGEIDSVEILIGETEVTANRDSVYLKNSKADVTLNQDITQLRQGNTFVTLKGEKLEIKNAGVSLKGLFDDLSNLIQNLKVVTAQGPSTTLTPDTITALTQFKTKYPTLLK